MKSAITSGRDVRVRIAHLVDELLGDRRHRDPPAGVRVLGDDERAVGACFDDGIADVGEIGNRSPVVQTVAARALRAALDDVPGDDAGGELIPARRAPAELVAKRRHRERGVGRAAGDDDVRAALERLDDRHRADVRVGGEHAIADGRERLAGVHVGERVSLSDQLVEPGEQIVAGHDADSQLAARRRASRPRP